MRKLEAASAYGFSYIAKDRPLTSVDMIQKALTDVSKDIGSGLCKQQFQNDGTACLVFTNKDKAKNAVISLNF